MLFHIFAVLFCRYDIDIAYFIIASVILAGCVW